MYVQSTSKFIHTTCKDPKAIFALKIALMSNQILHGQRQHSIHGARSAPLVSCLTEHDIPTGSRCWKKVGTQLDLHSTRCRMSGRHSLHLTMNCYEFAGDLCSSCFILIFIARTHLDSQHLIGCDGDFPPGVHSGGKHTHLFASTCG